MPALLLKLKAPMQAWGVNSRFRSRGTNLEPTKSGVVGMLSAALGRSRSSSVEDLVALDFAVRVDAAGQITRDYQTAKNIFAKKEENARLSTRYYLNDAVFVVALGGEEEQLKELVRALRSPAYPLFLGRRSCPANPDLVLGIREGTAEDALRSEPWHAPNWVKEKEPQQVTLRVLRDAREGEYGTDLPDVPVSFDEKHRQYTVRTVIEAAPVQVHNNRAPEQTTGEETMIPDNDADVFAFMEEAAK